MAQVFQISNGTTTINLVSPAGPYYLAAYETGINQWKSGGIFSSNEFSEGSIPIFRQFDTFEEKLTIHISGTSQDDVIDNLRDLVALLESGVNYFISGANNVADITEQLIASQVYMAVKGEFETNTRYAIITSYKLETLPNPFMNNFTVGGKTETLINSLYEEIEIVISRGIWLESPPGTLTSAYIKNSTVASTNAATVNVTCDDYLEVADTNLAGDLDPIGRLNLDATGINGSPNKVIIGRRRVSRGDDFFHILPFTDVGLPTGLSIDNAGSTTYVAEGTYSFYGKVARFPTLGASTSAASPGILIDDSIASSFVGRFRCFVRASNSRGGLFDPNADPIGRFNCSLQVATKEAPDMGLIFQALVTYPSVEMNADGSGPELLDFGIIELPSSLFRDGAVGNIYLHPIFSDNNPTLASANISLYDIILIPSDEYIIEVDAYLPSAGSKMLVIDKITSPEEPVDVSVQTSGSGKVDFRPVYGGSDSFNLSLATSRFYVWAYERKETITVTAGIFYNSGTIPATADFDARVYKLNRYLLPRGSA